MGKCRYLSAEIISDKIKKSIKEYNPAIEVKEATEVIIRKIVNKSYHDTQYNKKGILKGGYTFDYNYKFKEPSNFEFINGKWYCPPFEEAKELITKSDKGDLSDFYKILDENIDNTYFLSKLVRYDGEDGGYEDDFKRNKTIDILSVCSKWYFLPILKFDKSSTLTSIIIDSYSDNHSHLILPVFYTDIQFDLENTSLLNDTIIEYLADFPRPKRKKPSIFHDYIIIRAYELKKSNEAIKIGRCTGKNNISTTITTEIETIIDKCKRKKEDFNGFNDNTILKKAQEVIKFIENDELNNYEIKAIIDKGIKSIKSTLRKNIRKHVSKKKTLPEQTKSHNKKHHT